MIKTFLYFPMLKKCDVNLMLRNNGKTCCWWLMSLMFKCSWEILVFESEDIEVFKADRNKLVASNEKQTEKFT